MRNTIVTVGIVVVLLLIIILSAVGIYNGLVSREENVTKQWAQVESQYQRRADLIPNLVETVKGYAKHESETFEKVTEARSKATSMTISPEKLDEASLKAYQESQANLSSALARLMVVVEQYPELKANQNFLELQAQLEGTENRINMARNDYNEIVKSYNTNIRKFPKNIFASMFGFEKKPYFEAEQGAEKAPDVKF